MTDGQFIHLAMVVVAFAIYAAALAVQAWRNPGWPRRGRPAPEIRDEEQP
jgi:hypothetical protein